MRLKIWIVALGLLLMQGCEFASGPGGGTGGDGLTLTGVIVDPQGAAVVGATVRLYPEEFLLAKGAAASAPRRDSTVTDSAGRFRFKKLEAGRYNIEASVGTGNSARSVFIAGIYVTENTNLGADTLQASGSMSLVAEDANSVRLPGARCAIVGSPWETQSDETGRCTFTGLAPGRYRVLVTYPGLRSVVIENVTVYSGAQGSGGIVRLSPVDSGTDTTWTLRYGVEGQGVTGLASSGSLLVALGYSLDIYGEIERFTLTSPDGIDWTKREQPTSRYLGYVMWSGTQFLAVGDEGAVATSPDGVTWTARNAGTPNSWVHAVWTGTQFVVVGFVTSMTSPDGITWTRGENQEDVFYQVAWTGNVCVALTSDSIRTSPDGLTWTKRDAQTSNRLRSLAWGNGMLVAVGDNGVIRTSTDGIIWEKRVSGTTNTLSSVQWFKGRWIVDEGRLYSSDGILWLSGAASPGISSLVSIGTRSVGLGYYGIYTSP